MKRSLALAAAVLALFPGRVRADVIELRNGATLEGEVIAETDTSLTLRFEGGQVTFEKKLVASIRKEPKPEPPKPEVPKPEEPKSDGPRFVPPDPAAPKPRPAKPATPKPDAPKPDAPKPATPKPDAPKPATPKPDAPKPDAPKPDPAKPDPAGRPGISPAKEDWTLLWSPEKRAGWCRAQAAIEDAGKSIFEEETSLLGRGGKPEGTLRLVEEAGPGFQPLGFLFVTDSAGKQFSRSGRVAGGRLIVETWEDGEKKALDLPVPDGFRLLLGARAMVLRESGTAGASWSGPTFDPRTAEFLTVRFRVVRREPFRWEGTDLETIVLARTLGAVTTEERIALDGRVLAADLGPGGLSAVGSTRARVEALQKGAAEEEATESEMAGRMALVCPEDGFRIRKPGVSWVLVSPVSREARDRAAVKDFSGTVGVVVSSDPAPVGPEPVPADLGDALEERLKKESAEFRRIESGAAALGRSPGWRILADTEFHGDPVRILVITLARGGRVYTVTGMAPRASWSEAVPYIQRILEGIEWL